MLTSRCRRNPPDKLCDQGIGSAGTRNNPRSRMFKTLMSPTYSCALIISRSPACLVSVAISSTISIPLALCFWAKNYGNIVIFDVWRCLHVPSLDAPSPHCARTTEPHPRRLSHQRLSFQPETDRKWSLHETRQWGDSERFNAWFNACNACCNLQVALCLAKACRCKHRTRGLNRQRREQNHYNDDTSSQFCIGKVTVSGFLMISL